MPSHRIHRYVSRLLLGKSYSKIHEILDKPWHWLGRKHRRLFHTYPEAFCLGTTTSRDSYGGTAALLHVWLDRKCTTDKAFKEWIQFMEQQDRHFRKMMRLQAKLLTQRR